jgi:uncharacterized membrane protein
MRTLFCIAFAANVLLMLVSLAILPDQVAVHFGRGGVPDSCASKETNALLFIVLEIPLFLLFWLAPSLPFVLPERFVNVPNREYWLRDENRPAFRRKLQRLMAQFGTAFFLFFFCIELLTIEANLSQPVRLKEELFLPVLILFLGYTVVWSVGLIRCFRVPP